MHDLLGYKLISGVVAAGATIGLMAEQAASSPSLPAEWGLTLAALGAVYAYGHFRGEAKKTMKRLERQNAYLAAAIEIIAEAQGISLLELKRQHPDIDD